MCFLGGEYKGVYKIESLDNRSPYNKHSAVKFFHLEYCCIANTVNAKCFEKYSILHKLLASCEILCGRR